MTVFDTLNPESRHRVSQNGTCAMGTGPGLRRVPSFPWLVLLWFLMVTPLVFLRDAHYEEGTVIALARGCFEDGHWLVPHRYGVRFAERPGLVSWLLGGMGWAAGALPLWLARVPMVLALLAGTGLVYRFTRRYAGAGAGLFAGVSFLVSPMILQKTVTVEVDVVVSAGLFLAFTLWWSGHARGEVGAGRWAGIAAVLAVASLVKGPQPLGYFFLGVGAYLLVTRRWRELAGLAAAAVPAAAVTGAWYWAVHRPGDLFLWRVHSRVLAPVSPAAWGVGAGRFAVQLLLEWMPGLWVAAPFAFLALRGPRDTKRDLALALALYAAVCSVILVPWPHARTRYAMPSLPAVAVLAGLGFGEVASRRRGFARAGLATAAGLTAYALTGSCVLAPVAPRLVRPGLAAAQALSAAVRGLPGGLYVTPGALDKSALVHVPVRIRQVPAGALDRLAAPFCALVTPAEQAALAAGGRYREIGRFRLRGNDARLLRCDPR